MSGNLEDKYVGTSRLGHRYFWTYDVQMIVGGLTTLGLLAYEGFPTPCACWCYLCVFLGAIVFFWVKRVELGKLRDNLRAASSRKESC